MSLVYKRWIYFTKFSGLQYTANWDIGNTARAGSNQTYKVRCFFSIDQYEIVQLKQWISINTNNTLDGIQPPTLKLLNDLDTDGNTYMSVDYYISGTEGSTVVDFTQCSGLVKAFKQLYGSGVYNSNTNPFYFYIYAFVVDPTFNDPIFRKVNIGGTPTNGQQLWQTTDNYSTTKNLPIPLADVGGNGGETNDYGQVISFKCYAVNAMSAGDNPDLNAFGFSGVGLANVPYNGYLNTGLWFVNSWGYSQVYGTYTGGRFPNNEQYSIETFGSFSPSGLLNGWGTPNFSPVTAINGNTDYLYWNDPYITPNSGSNQNPNGTQPLWGGADTKNNTTSGTYPLVPPTPKMIAHNVSHQAQGTSFTVPQSNLVNSVQNLAVVPNSVFFDKSFKVTWDAPSDYYSYARISAFIKIIVTFYYHINTQNGSYASFSIIYDDNNGPISNGRVLSSSPLTITSPNFEPNTTFQFDVTMAYYLTSNGVQVQSPPSSRSSFTTGTVINYPIITNVITKSNNVTVNWDYDSIAPERGGIFNIYLFIVQNLVDDGNGPQLPAPNTNQNGYLVPLNADGSDPKTLTITDLPSGTYYAEIITYYNNTIVNYDRSYNTYLNPFVIPVISTSVSTPKVLGNAISQVNPSESSKSGIKLYITPSIYTDPSGNKLNASYYILSAANITYYEYQNTTISDKYNLLPQINISATLTTDSNGKSYYFWTSSNNVADNITLQNGQSYEFYATGVYVDADGNTYTSAISDASEPFFPTSKTPDVPSGLTGSVDGNYVTLYVNQSNGLYGIPTTGYLFNFNNPSLPIFDSANLISGNGPNNTLQFIIPQPLDVGSYSVSASSGGVVANQARYSDYCSPISLEITPRIPPNITSVRVFPGQNTYYVYWTVDPVVDTNSQVSPTYFLVSYKTHGETGEGTELAYSNMYAMTTQIGGTLDSDSQFPNGNKAVVYNYPYSTNFHLDTTGNTLYDFKVTPYSVIQTQSGTITTTNQGLWDTNDGDGYSIKNAELGSLLPINVTYGYNSANNQYIVTTIWQSLVGANIYKILQVYEGGFTLPLTLPSNSYPTADTDNTTIYSVPTYSQNGDPFFAPKLLEVIAFAQNDDTGAFSTSSGISNSNFINVTQ